MFLSELILIPLFFSLAFLFSFGLGFPPFFHACWFVVVVMCQNSILSLVFTYSMSVEKFSTLMKILIIHFFCFILIAIQHFSKKAECLLLALCYFQNILVIRKSVWLSRGRRVVWSRTQGGWCTCLLQVKVCAGPHTLGSPVVAGGIHIHPTLVNNYR